MPDNAHIANTRNRYIELTKRFFDELDKGSSLDDLQPLQEEIEKTLLELDDLEKQDSNDAD